LNRFDVLADEILNGLLVEIKERKTHFAFVHQDIRVVYARGATAVIRSPSSQTGDVLFSFRDSRESR